MGYFTERKFEPKPKIAIVGGGRNVGKTMTALLETREELEKYKAIGTVEEFAEFKEKQIPKKILYRKQNYGTPWLCCECEADQTPTEFFSEDGSEPKEKHTFCWKCGQKLDWRNEEWLK